MNAKTKTAVAPAAPRSVPTEDEIRDYAYHLYVQSGCVPGRDLENWLDAKSCLEANIPKEKSHQRSSRHRHRHRASTSTEEPATFVGIAESDIGDGLVLDELVLIQSETPPLR